MFQVRRCPVLRGRGKGRCIEAADEIAQERSALIGRLTNQRSQCGLHAVVVIDEPNRAQRIVRLFWSVPDLLPISDRSTALPASNLPPTASSSPLTTAMLAAQPVLADMRARRDAVADIEADHRGAYADWINAGRHVETTRAALDDARDRLAVLTAEGGTADPEQVSISEAGVFTRENAARTAAAWASETHQTYRTLDDALTAAAGPAGVIRSADIDHARLLAHSLDDAHTTELREKVTTVSDQLFRAENAAARYEAAGQLALLPRTTGPDSAASTGDLDAQAAPIAVLAEPATVRWAEVAETHVPGITSDQGWEDPADAIARIDAAGYDVTAVLPVAAAAAPLPRRPATELTYRLYEKPPSVAADPNEDRSGRTSEPARGDRDPVLRPRRDPSPDRPPGHRH